MKTYFIRLLFRRLVIFSLTAWLPLHAMQQVETMDIIQVTDKAQASGKVQQILATCAPQGGNKFANLCVLDKLIVEDQELQTKLHTHGLTVAVPDFRIITDQEGKRIISLQGLNLEKEWKSAIHATDIKTFIEQSNQLSELIKNLKQTHSDKPEFFSPMIQEFLKHASENHWPLIVRSTSKEDSDTQSNAGGNESIPFVQPNEAALLSTVNKVIASYFSSKSLSQRSENETLEQLKAMPPTPVLIQRMVGEIDPARQEPSIGCVIYTQESYANTGNITVIQAVLGHNKGLVDGDVQADTYFVGEHDDVYSVIRNKPKRIIPMLKGQFEGLGFAENLQKIRKLSVLHSNEIAALKLVADAIHRTYGKVMDIELVFDRQAKTIFLVQARPLKVTTRFEPSYIETVPTEDVISGSTTLPGNCSVKHITYKGQILVASTLEAALNKYNSTEYNKKGLEVVVVQEQACITSHAAAIFRGAGKAVIVLPDTTTLESWLKNQQFSLWVDVQRGVIVNAANVDIKPGWFKHPIPQRLSCIPKEIKDSFPKFKICFSDKSLSQLSDMLKDANEPSAQKALESVLSTIQTELASIADDVKDPYFRAAAYASACKLSDVLGCACNTAINILPTLSLPPRDIKRLYHINSLDALLDQNKFPGDVKTYSFKNICQHYKQEKELIAKLTPMIKTGQFSKKLVSDYKTFKQVFNGHNIAFTPELEMQWISLMNFVTQNPEYSKVIQLVHNLGMMASFINGYLNAFVSSGKDFANPDVIKEFLQKATSEVEQFEKFISKLGEFKQQLTTYSFSDWEKPDLFAKQLEHFNKTFIPFFTSQELQNVLASNNLFAQLATLSVMDLFVSVFDTAIKTLKGSNLYPNDEEKAVNFKQILMSYFNFMKKWTEYLPAGSIRFYFWSLQKYLDVLERAVHNPANAEQLIASQNFSVENFVLGSESYEERCPPKRLEDAFMLIHQNLLIISGAIAKQIIPANIQKPVAFEIVEKELVSTSTGQINPWITSFHFNGSSINARYNRPLKNHSIIFELSYNKNDSHTRLLIMFVGLALDRWDCINKFSSVLPMLLENLSTRTLRLNENEVCIQFDISTPYTINLRDIIIAMIEASFVGHKQMIDLFTNLSLKMDSSKRLALAKTLPHYSKIRLGIFIGLVKTNHKSTFDEASIAASEALKSGDYDTRSAGIDLFTKLFKEKYQPAFDKAIQTASEELKSYVQDTKLASGIDLFSELFKEKYQPAFDKAIQTASEALKSSDYGTRSAGIDLFSELFKEKYQPAFDKAIQIASEELKSYVQDTKLASGIDLFSELFKENYQPAFDKAIQIASEALKSSAYNTILAGIDLFTKLFKANYKAAFEKATDAANAASEALKSNNFNIIKSSLNLLTELVKANYEAAFENATYAATFAMKNDQFKLLGLELFTKLVKANHAHAFEPAAEAASVAMESGIACIKNSGLELFIELFKAKHETVLFKKFIEFANLELTIGHTDSSVKLFRELVKANYKAAFEEAAYAAYVGILNGISGFGLNLINSSFEIFGDLFKANYQPAFAKAREILPQISDTGIRNQLEALIKSTQKS